MSLVKTIILSPKRLRDFPGLAEAAIQRAIQRAKIRIREAAMLQTPVWTGTLRNSFEIGSGPRSIFFKWFARAPGSLFPYAKVVEEGRTGGAILTPKTKKAMKFQYPWKGGPFRFSKGPLIQGGFAPRYYAAAVKQYAIQALREELEMEFLAIGS